MAREPTLALLATANRHALSLPPPQTARSVSDDRANQKAHSRPLRAIASDRRSRNLDYWMVILFSTFQVPSFFDT